MLQLEKSIVDASANVYFLIGLKAKNAFETVIKELQTMPNTESAVQQLQSKILDFENRYQPCKTVQEQHLMASIYPEIMVNYPPELQESENNDVKLIVNVMKKFDVHNFRKIFQSVVAEYVRIFEEKFQELKEPIKRENEMLSNELNKWFEEVYSKRNDLFYKYTRIFSLPYKQFFAANTGNNFYSL